MDLRRVVEVSLLAPLTRVPGAAPALRGVVNRRGAVTPIVDVGARLGLGPARISARTCVIHANARIEGTIAPVGLLVDAIAGIHRLAAGEVGRAHV